MPARSDLSATPAVLADEAVEAVIRWYDASRRDLPWRAPDATPWSVLVSEIMLQQTPVVRVLPRWQEWMRRWPEPADLASASTADVLRAWDRLGYPRRALRLHECAKALVADHGGAVPADSGALRALPGIGEYTAAAVGAFAFGHRTVVADVNIRRVLVRALLGHPHPAPGYTAAERALATATLPPDPVRSVRWNRAVMELGALICVARTPRCESCPLADHGCAYLRADRPEQVAVPHRRVQPFAGTDRQMRGMIMARLRDDGPTPRARLADLDPGDPSRVQRCLASLLADGLAAERDGVVDLP